MSLDTALARGRAAHEALMVDAGRLIRPGPAALDRATGQMVPGPETVLYDGRARVKPQPAVGRDVTAGERLQILREYEIALPWSALPPDAVRLGDVWETTASPDARLVGQRLVVKTAQNSATATAWRITGEVSG
ncbi:DUF6093 family protein [Yinghuangia aomiensis]